MYVFSMLFKIKKCTSLAEYVHYLADDIKYFKISIIQFISIAERDVFKDEAMLEYTFMAGFFLNSSLVSSRKGFIPSSQAFPIEGSRGIFPNNGTFISLAIFSAPPENKIIKSW